MIQLFLKIINLNLSTVWLILALLILRFVLKKAPKWIHVLLWGFLAFRLLCPFSIESKWSLIPSTETLPEQIISGSSFQVQTGIPLIDNSMNNYLGDRYFEDVTVPANHGYHVLSILTVIWIIGMLLLLTYTAISYWHIHQEIAAATWYRDNIFQCKKINSPFVFGIIQPRIFLPLSMETKMTEHVIAHEKTHLSRKDHWWKLLGFLLLIIHWFNPLIWLSFLLLCHDIELACDEKVIQALPNNQRADYAEALLTCSILRHQTPTCPLAFGEIGVKERVNAILHYQKPTFWVFLMTIAACFMVTVCFLANPIKPTIGYILSNDYYTVLTQNQANITLTIPKTALPDAIYTQSGHEFKKDEAVVYQTDTTAIYLYKAMISNESDDWLYFIFDFSYDFSNHGKVLSPIAYYGGYYNTLQLRNKDLRDNSQVYPEALDIRGHGPGTMFAFYVSVDACKAAKENIYIDVSCDELIYAKKGYENQAVK